MALYDIFSRANMNRLFVRLDSLLRNYVKVADNKDPDGLLYLNGKLYLSKGGSTIGNGVTVSQTGGGGSTSSAITITNLLDSNMLTVASGSAVTLRFTYASSEDTGDGMAYIYVGDVLKGNIRIVQGDNSIDVTKYVGEGINTVKVLCIDMYSNQKSISYTVDVIALKVTSTFDDSVIYTEDLRIRYVAYGSVEKTVHFLLDGEEVASVVTSESGKTAVQVIALPSHGSHVLEIYVSAAFSGSESETESAVLTYEFMAVHEYEYEAMIASPYTVDSVVQGELIDIPFSVYDPMNETCEVTLTIISGGVTYTSNTRTIDRTRQRWQTRDYPVGEVTFQISYGDLEPKTHIVNVSEANIPVKVTDVELEMSLVSAGRSNVDKDKEVWADGDVTTTFSNVNWQNTGWVADENGDAALRLSGDASAVIEYKPFATDARSTGRTIELDFAIRDVNNREAVAISCVSGGIGFTVTADHAALSSEQSTIDCRYRDGERVRIVFAIESTQEYRMLSVYLNGILSGAKQYPANDNFAQTTPVSITVGSPLCAIDLYKIRGYAIALNADQVRDNYIADIADITDKAAVYSDNNIYNTYGQIDLAAMRSRIPVMIITGALPTVKGDKKNVTISYTDPVNTSLNFEDTAVIDVQGTSSQWYVRKNWKVKTSLYHQHAPGQLEAKVFCMKADYAEATGTHNTGNANYAHTLYDTKTPPQEADERVRTTIYGFPCVIFHKADSASTPEFIGKYNFNYDKGAENIFGFTSDYPNAECWEFCNNTSDACLFHGEIPESWGDDFEARYPDGFKDISAFKVMHDWIVSTWQDGATGDELTSPVTYGDTTYTNDTAEYRLAKFGAEFEDYFNLDFCLVYYVYTFVMLMVDQRAKNMFLTTWDGVHWEPWLYDNDTCLGINNEGSLVFDYYHEDIDKLGTANVYNGQESALWVNFRETYADEIAERYRSLRSDGRLSFDNIWTYFIENQAKKWSASVYNEDSDYKYISMLRSDGNATNLPQIRGTGMEHLGYYVDNRLKYCDSKWYASEYVDNHIVVRIYTPSGDNLVVTPCADITVTPFSAMYAGVRYKANGTLYQHRVYENDAYTFEAPEETFNDTETAIYGASEISSLGDLAPLYPGYLDVSKATRLVNLKIGDSTEGYDNPNFTYLSVGTNRLLRVLDVRNCSQLGVEKEGQTTTTVLGLSGCSGIEEIYAEGTAIKGVELPSSGYLKVMHLPETLTNLTVTNQKSLTDFSIAGVNALTTLRVENTTGIDTFNIALNAGLLNRVRLVNVDWTVDDETDLNALIQKLKTCGGLDENGANVDNAVLSGMVSLDAISAELLEDIQNNFPNLLVIVGSEPQYVVRYLDWDGTVLYKLPISLGGNVIDPVAAGMIEAPTRQPTDGAGYEFVSFGSLPTNVQGSVTVVAVYTATFRVRFMHGSTVYSEQWIIKGRSATAPSNPTKASTAQYTYTFSHWEGKYTLITAPVDIIAVFTETVRTYTVTFYNGSTVLQTNNNVPYGSSVTFEGETPVHSSDPDNYEFMGWSPAPTNITGTTKCYAQFVYTAIEETITDSWEEIFAAEADGTYLEKYAIGDTKLLSVGTEGYVAMQIAGFNVDALADGTGYAPITWISEQLLKTDKRFNPTLVTNYEYQDVPAWTCNSSTGKWLTSNDQQTYTHYIATWTITALTAGTVTITYKTGASSTNQAYATLTVNGETLLNAGHKTPLTHSIECSEGDAVTVYIDYYDKGNKKQANMTFTSTGEIATEVDTENIEQKSVSDYQEFTGAIGGWEKSELRAYMNDTVKPMIQADVLAGIKAVTKTQPSYNTAGTSETQTTQDDIWIPSYEECFSSGAYTGLFTADADRVKYRAGVTYPDNWWLRSAAGMGAFRFVINSAGYTTTDSADKKKHIALGFCT